jgi:hypothetical protein
MRVRAELRYLERAIPKLADFLMLDSGWQSPAQGKSIGSTTYNIRIHLLPDMLAEISRLETRIKGASQDLISSVSIIESRKGITEAENIARLIDLDLSLPLLNIFICSLLRLSSIPFHPSGFHRNLL